MSAKHWKQHGMQGPAPCHFLPDRVGGLRPEGISGSRQTLIKLHAPGQLDKLTAGPSPDDAAHINFCSMSCSLFQDTLGSQSRHKIFMPEAVGHDARRPYSSLLMRCERCLHYSKTWPSKA